jgi:hypothetical protein
MKSRSRSLVVALALLSGAAVAVLLTEGLRPEGRRSEEFQRLVGGLGFGPVGDLSGCPCGFDPRLDGSCGEDCGPVPGGRPFCPRHAGSVMYYRPPGGEDGPTP